VLDGLGDACSAVAEPQGIKVLFSVSAQQKFRPPEGDEWAEFVFGQGAVFPPRRREFLCSFISQRLCVSAGDGFGIARRVPVSPRRGGGPD
jgi:hypothetical protein